MLRKSQQKIPKQLFVTAKSPLNPRLSHHLDSLQKSNPDYHLNVYDDSSCFDYVHNQWGEFVTSIYESIAAEYIVAKMDLWRYLIIYDRGGIYLDDKSGPVKGFAKVIKPNDELLLSTWGMNAEKWQNSHRHPHGEFLQWCIPARPRHPLIKAVILEVVSRIINATGEESGKLGVIEMTGPIAYTTAILNNLSEHKHQATIQRNSFQKRMYFDAISKSVGLTKNHHAMRAPERNYRLLDSPIISPAKSRAFLEKFPEDPSESLEHKVFKTIDERHMP